MNKTTIEWCNYTWNPVTGCFHQCRHTYCYNTQKPTSPLNRFGARYRLPDGTFRYEKDWPSRQTNTCHIAVKGEIYPYGYDPTFYPHRLDEPFRVQKPARIFVVDTGDLFGNWVPEEWIEKIRMVVQRCFWHTFIYLTKNPLRLNNYTFLPNEWVGTTITSQEDIQRAEALKGVHARIKFLSIEPLLGPVELNLSGFQWIIIGAQTGPGAIKPDKLWVDMLLKEALKHKIPVFIKNNLGFFKNFRQFPA
jgi:protein gp37